MPTRVLLRMMLVTLAAAALIGVVAIFVAPSVTGRAAITALAAAVCIALAMPVSRLMDRETSRPGGLVGLAAIVLSMIVFLVAIWGGLFLPWSAEEKLAGTGFLVLIGGVVAGFLITAWKKPGFAWAARVGVLADVFGACFAIAAIWIGNYPLDENLAITAANGAAAGAGAAMCLIGLGRSMGLWQWVGVAAAVVQFSLGIIGTWYIKSDDPTLYAAATSVALVIGHANVIIRVPAGGSSIWAKLGAIGGMASSGVCATLTIMVEEWYGGTQSDFLPRILGASGLVAACGTMAVLIMYRLNKRPAGAVVGSFGAVTQVQLTCPICGKAQQMPVLPKVGRCAACNLVIQVSVREPRCGKCEYPLLNVRGDRCPECGEPIALPAPELPANEKPPDESGGS